ncbi:ADP-ribose 1''-phosphate phosphatase [Ophidiomyces ophidiicola]|uniref:ADP-ribose 1''-phosphate phosphatase n=1 Tax=Ophidiomyces ophidiicola TaxID=1387563 RepID=A0ACB8UP20_9EURO|nr:ADP-ribose 1''-phosphate phosphatase [Ophidiomyces ophidiicola]KAI1908881.1 ADP-ribose 1''-phosphate phosphatase [Ophidiomyces ophidiicola]KAI1916447.1 ADP-ribose 1''-phosphate phosphatase [Ophidiomyces ophidiicola]KAI1928823.1 ADP-ribose 1''-phosphate phosphatase [Ophidiomyces ophidiicola]KAI1938206.1 ADP-ribose 1''-phosphate phosphatase [Ophidiomyces ophidiicola]KAI1939223.1 ADP-ribose 1''-phosphate phosphatase [Ophidiomyces ophidiicola]
MAVELQGDLFDAPDNAVLIHACNCQGSWGKGIAAIFRNKYPAAYRIYRAHCQKHLLEMKKISKETSGAVSHGSADVSRTQQRHSKQSLRTLEGTTLLIRPQASDYISGQRKRSSTKHKRGTLSTPEEVTGRKHWIACLFTSWHYGSKKGMPDEVLENTALALEDLKRQLEELPLREKNETGGYPADEEGDNGKLEEKPTELWSCRLNAGLFGVPWASTKEIIDELGLFITVIIPPGEPL